MRLFIVAVFGILVVTTLSAADATWSERIAWTGGWLFLAWVLLGAPLPGGTP